MSTIHPRRRLALAVALGALLMLGATTPASAAPSPSYLLDGGDHWFTHDSGYPVVLGPAEVHLGKRVVQGTVAATLHPDDYSMPAAGECESALAFVYVDGTKKAPDVWLSSAGEVCGLWLQEPNVVAHVFTGVATFEESGQRNLQGQEGFLEIRLAVDGRASVFVTTW